MNKRKTKDGPLTDMLKQAIRDSGMGFRELERETGVLRQSLMTFMAGKSSLRLDIADKLATYFKLKLQPVSKKKGN